MPISLTFILFPATIFVLWLASLKLKSPPARIKVIVALLCVYLTPALIVVFPQYVLEHRIQGEANGELYYRLGRLIECKADYLSFWYPIPGRPQVEEGLVYLEKAAQLEHPPAMYTLGVRILDDFYMGQKSYSRSNAMVLIQRSKEKGFFTKEPQQTYYMKSYRNWPWRVK